MKEEEERQKTCSAWINKEKAIVSFQEVDGFKEVIFSTHDEMFMLVVKLSQSGYRIQ